MPHINANVPSGLRPVRDASSRYYSGGTNRYIVPASNADAMAEGDPVYITGGGNLRGYANVGLIGPGAPGMTGVIVGFEPITERDQPRYIMPGMEFEVIVADDPGIECLIQANDVVDETMIGKNVDFAVGAPNTIYGLSGYQADIATVGTAATLPMQIVGIYDSPDNQLYDETGAGLTNVTLKVRLNNSARVDAEDGV